MEVNSNYMQQYHDEEDFVNCSSAMMKRILWTAVSRHDTWVHHYKPDSKNKQAMEWKYISQLKKALKHQL
jgi:hypothetical protein